jgi:glutathione S-transferase
MRLHTSNTTPFGRKVMIVAHEVGLAGRIATVITDTASPELAEVNPLSKIPALLLDDGQTLFDSRVICEYLDSLQDGPTLHPAAGPARWAALRLQALADGICEAAVLRLLESRRPESFQWSEWTSRQRRKVLQGLRALEQDLPPEPPNIGSLAALAALGYLDFRFAAEPWRDGHPRLASWFAQASRRPGFQLTAPA